MNQLKKILILTHKLGCNYGGIMQAYALQTKLQQISQCSVVTTDMAKSGLLLKIARWMKFIVNKMITRRSIMPPCFEEEYSCNNQLFIQKHIRTITQKEAKNKYFLGNLGSLVVGSDQVWRQAYVPVDKYLFSFVKDDSIPRISYAASFGRDDLNEYSTRLIKKTTKLAKKFEAISVREKSGIELVKKHWGVNAYCHIDPTLMFDANHYSELIEKDGCNLGKGSSKIFAYVLDGEGEKKKIIDKVANELKTGVFEILPKKPKTYFEYKKNPEKYNLPPITQWIKAFRDSEFIITDSFHGCVFSIIYNKPFLVIGNKERGLARFVSLLDLFELKNRLVSSETDVTKELINSIIDWKKINAIIKNERARSEKYIQENLNV